MKILVFIKSSLTSGGLETQNQLLVDGLKKRGHGVEVVKTESPFGNSVAVEEDVDVVISQSAAGTRFLLSRKGRRPPVVVIQHGTLLSSLKTHWRMGPSLRLFPYAIKAYFLDQIRLRRCESIIAVSKKVKRDLVREYFLPKDKVSVVYNGIEIERFANRQSTIVNRKTILYLGRLAPEKGLMPLLSATSNLKFQISNLKLLIVGDGALFDKLNYRSRELGLGDQVRFVGRVPYEETPKYYREANVFVLPSTAHEGLPMTIIEAMAAGLPVVASRIGGIPEAVMEGKTGVLVEPGNVNQLTEALAKILTNDVLRLKMGKRAQTVAKEKFSQETMVEKTLKILEDVSQ